MLINGTDLIIITAMVSSSLFGCVWLITNYLEFKVKGEIKIEKDRNKNNL